MPLRISPIALLAAYSGPLADGVDRQAATADLLVALATVPDPRKARGLRPWLIRSFVILRVRSWG